MHYYYFTSRKMSDDQFWHAIKQVESGGDENAVGDNGMSIGALQIQRAYCNDATERNSSLQSGKYAGYKYENCKGRGSFEYTRAVAEAYTWIDMPLKDDLVILLLMKTSLACTMEDLMDTKCQLLYLTGKR